MVFTTKTPPDSANLRVFEPLQSEERVVEVNSISLVIPAYNEETIIVSIVERSLRVLHEFVDDYEIIILDAASTDGTYNVIQQTKEWDPDHIRIYRHGRNLGVPRTFAELYNLATKDYVFLVPGNGRYPPEILQECLKYTQDNDIVICQRTFKSYTLFRRVVSKCFRSVPRLIFGVDTYDPGSVKCVRREILQTITVNSKSVFAEAERLIRATKRGYRIAKVDVVHSPRQQGKASSTALKTVIHASIDMIALWINLYIIRNKP